MLTLCRKYLYYQEPYLNDYGKEIKETRFEDPEEATYLHSCINDATLFYITTWVEIVYSGVCHHLHGVLPCLLFFPGIELLHMASNGDILHVHRPSMHMVP